ncbi:MAG TPA: serine/threonine-protein kinase [Polyangia bacterium]|jgi:serine/threonine-protein kinase|nr:serine/threonine-protein kinase [Polyangia bacterium]
MSEGDVERRQAGESAGPANPGESPAVRIGAVVDRYTVVRLLGQGGMGAVYEVRHATLARRMAIKFLLPELAANRDVLRRFENEAKAAGGLEHPNLVAVTDFGRATDGAPYLVMEFLEGQDCSRLLRAYGPLPVPRATDIVLQACRGLAIAHKADIVHRDLKPENLFVTDAGDGSDLVKVLDFGIAKLRPTDASVVTGTGAMFGTAFYMSPEQARGAGEVDARTDVWSLGVVLYELLSGRRPFQGEQFLQVVHQILSADPPPLASVRPGLPDKLSALIERAMAKDPKDRPPSALALAEALKPFAGRTSQSQNLSSAEALAATRATPATRTGEPSLVPRKTGPASSNARVPTGAGLAEAVAPDPRAATTAPVTRSGGRGRFIAAFAAAAVLAGGAAYWLASRHASNAGLGLAVNPPAAASTREAAPRNALTTESSPTAAVPQPAAPVLPAAPAAAATPPAALARTPAAKPVRTVSERSEHGWSRPSAPSAAARRARETAAPVVVEPVKPAPAQAAPSAGHPIEIEKENPYGQ